MMSERSSWVLRSTSASCAVVSSRDEASQPRLARDSLQARRLARLLARTAAALTIRMIVLSRLLVIVGLVSGSGRANASWLTPLSRARLATAGAAGAAA